MSDGMRLAHGHTGFMPNANQKSKPVPVSSSRNRFANSRTMLVVGVVALFLIVAVFVPW